MAKAQEITERRSIINRYLLRYPDKTQEEICEYLEKNRGLVVTQTTVNRDLKELGFRKTTNGYKLRYPKKGAGLERQQLEDIFKFDVPTMINCFPLYTVSIKVNKGSANRIARLIEEEYGDKITGTISGENLVLVFTSSENKAQTICKSLRKSRFNVTKIDASEEEVEED